MLRLWKPFEEMDAWYDQTIVEAAFGLSLQKKGMKFLC